MGDQVDIIRLPARVITDQQGPVNLDLINRLTLEPVKEEEIFTFSGICSNDRLDSYFTKMDPVTTLRNYVDDLKAGTSLQEGHDIRKNPYGRSYDGILIPAGDEPGSFNAVRGHWYIIRGLTINGSNTDDTIRAIKAGIIRDMSVGFGGQEMWYRCSSCGRDIWDWECPHIPGLMDENDRLNFAWVVDAHLREVSTVYKGSTPGAYIDKARQYIEQGQLSQQHIHQLEQRYQVRLDDGKRSFYFTEKKEGSRMDLLEMIRQALRENKVEKRSIYEVLQKEGKVFRQPDDIAIRNELGEAATVEGVRQLMKEAEQGRTYAADLIDQAVAARVRAQGEGFDAEKYKSMLVRSGDLDFVKEEIKSYDELAKQRFTTGRQTKTEEFGKETNPAPASRNDYVEENIFE